MNQLYLTILIGLLPFSKLLSQNTQVLDLLFVGDVMGHDGQIESAKVVGGDFYDYSPCFEYLKPIIKEADFAVANLEVTLPGKPPYKGYPRFRSPDELALALRHAGFDMLVTANNHSNDARKSGVLSTIQTLEEYGFYQTGTFRNAAQREIYYPLLVYKNNFKLAFLNCTYGTNGLPTQAPTIVNLIDEKQIKADLQAAKDLSPDYIIMMIHWGAEYQLIESKKQQRLAEKMFEWGADMIIGAHPHVIQPIYVKEKQGKQKLIAYSLGNFISSQTKPNTDGGLILKVQLEKNMDTQTTSLKDQEHILVWRHIEKKEDGRKVYRSIPVRDFENKTHPEINFSAADLSKMNSFVSRMRKHLMKSDSREKILQPAN